MQVSYRFSRHEGQEYRELLATVSEVSQEEVKQIAESAELIDSRNRNADLIEQIKVIIASGVVQKTDIITQAHKETRKSREQIRKILERHAGVSELMGYSWKLMTGPNNAQIYSLFDKHPPASTKINTPPVASQSPNNTPANPEKPANPIRERVRSYIHIPPEIEKPANPIATGVLVLANRMEDSANPANPIVIVLGANNATAINTCKLAYRLLAMDDDHVAINSAMADYLKAKGRIVG
jgi:glutaminase